MSYVIKLADDLVSRLELVSQNQGIELERAANEILREGLRHVEANVATSRPRVTSRDLGRCLVGSLQELAVESKGNDR